MRERLKEEQITRVIIRGTGFRIGIITDSRPSSFMARRPGRSVEFDALADAVGAAADDYEFGFVGEADFGFGDAICR